jgi:hypothetical protein
VQTCLSRRLVLLRLSPLSTTVGVPGIMASAVCVLSPSVSRRTFLLVCGGRATL